jgi:hypothetical protein
MIPVTMSARPNIALAHKKYAETKELHINTVFVRKL